MQRRRAVVLPRVSRPASMVGSSSPLVPPTPVARRPARGASTSRPAMMSAPGAAGGDDDGARAHQRRGGRSASRALAERVVAPEAWMLETDFDTETPEGVRDFPPGRAAQRRIRLEDTPVAPSSADQSLSRRRGASGSRRRARADVRESARRAASNGGQSPHRRSGLAGRPAARRCRTRDAARDRSLGSRCSDRIRWAGSRSCRHRSWTSPRRPGRHRPVVSVAIAPAHPQRSPLSSPPRVRCS